MEKTNFKKWGWWALWGVVVILIIAALVSSLGSGPKPADGELTEDEGQGQTEIVADESATEEEEAKAGDDAAGDMDALPQSGPVEDGMLGLLLAGAFAYVMSLALGSVFRAAKAEK